MLTAWDVHKGWMKRAGLVLVATVFAEVVIVLVAEHPIRWVGWVAGTLPLSMYWFVALPLIRRDSYKP
jgi:hypothetical protein